MALTKFGGPDWSAGRPPEDAATHPSQHRYPVWWTGDGVTLQGSVESMVDAGLHHFKPFVHSDCGGDSGSHYNGSGTAGDLMRWTAHCAFGSILRFHGADHRAWRYDDHTVDVVRSYLQMRYRLLPSLISAGAVATATGFPLIARGDFFWPNLADSRTNQQYLFLNDTLVAPIWDSVQSETSRSVWIPPGQWQDAWSGDVVAGPANITTTQPFERIPMWHRRGGLVVLSNSPATRVEDQDWSCLTLDVFTAQQDENDSIVTNRILAERATSARTELQLVMDGRGRAALQISPSNQSNARAWVIRLHLLPGERVLGGRLDGLRLDPDAHVIHLEAADGAGSTFLPFGGAGAAPAQGAGAIAELRLPSAIGDRLLEVQIHRLAV